MGGRMNSGSQFCDLPHHSTVQYSTIVQYSTSLNCVDLKSLFHFELRATTVIGLFYNHPEIFYDFMTF